MATVKYFDKILMRMIRMKSRRVIYLSSAYLTKSSHYVIIMIRFQENTKHVKQFQHEKPISPTLNCKCKIFLTEWRSSFVKVHCFHKPVHYMLLVLLPLVLCQLVWFSLSNLVYHGFSSLLHRWKTKTALILTPYFPPHLKMKSTM